jgi:hypothetical protein
MRGRSVVGEAESGSGSLSESVSTGRGTGFGHERLDVYRAPIKYLGLAYLFCEGLKAHRNARNQLLRASQIESWRC